MLVVSDTTAITSLMKIERIELLAQLFSDVAIPEAVRDELLIFHRDIPKFLKAYSVAQSEDEITTLNLGRGEMEAILLAEQLRAGALLIDEKRGRGIAQARGIDCIGLVGVLVLAKRNGLIPNIRDVLRSLEARSRFYLAGDFKKALLAQNGE
jgi:predicted nucleic acid-binding protein